jgi:hypothetical protein
MPWTIIVASSETDQLAELRKGAQEIEAKIRLSGGDSVVHEAVSVEDVRRLRANGHDTRTQLIIVTASLPDSRSGLNSQDLAGLTFVREVQAEPSPPACILVSDRPEHWGDVQGMSRCRLLLVGAGTNYIDDCANIAEDLGVWARAAEPQARPRGSDLPVAESRRISHEAVADPTYALIEVDLPDDAKFATVRSVVRYPRRDRAIDNTPLGLKQRKVDDLVRESRKLSEKFSKALKSAKKYEEWQNDYRSLGERFFKLLNTRDFAEQLNYAKGAAGQDVRLRFNLSPPVYDGLWESLFDPKANRYLMLDLTITRKGRGFIDQFASGRGGDVGALNVLVIGANVDDNAVPKGPDDPLWRKFWGTSRLVKLPHIDKEVAALQALEKAPGSTGAVKIKVDVISSADFKGETGIWSMAEKVRELLAKEPNRYDVVHFAGHALFHAKKQRSGTSGDRRRAAVKSRKVTSDDRGYLVFSGSSDPEAIPIAKVASWLTGTSVDLVYLSCCRSSAAQAAAELARNNVRTAIGFSWDLDDSKAVDFATLFYEALLGNQLKVCSAIRDARDKLHKQYDAGDPIWASPVLVAQPQDWLSVEAVLRPPVRTAQPAIGAGPP